MRRHCFALMFLSILSAAVLAQEVPVRAERKNLVGAEIGGRGLFFTFQYEYFADPKLGIGFGFFGAGSSDGWFGILPIYLSFVPGDVHSLYVSVGYTALLGDVDDEDFDQGLLGASVGYQFHSRGGLYVRPTFTLLFDEDDTALLWPGVAIGGSF